MQLHAMLDLGTLALMAKVYVESMHKTMNISHPSYHSNVSFYSTIQRHKWLPNNLSGCHSLIFNSCGNGSTRQNELLFQTLHYIGGHFLIPLVSLVNGALVEIWLKCK